MFLITIGRGGLLRFRRAWRLECEPFCMASHGCGTVSYLVDVPPVYNEESLERHIMHICLPRTPNSLHARHTTQWPILAFLLSNLSAPLLVVHISSISIIRKVSIITLATEGVTLLLPTVDLYLLRHVSNQVIFSLGQNRKHTKHRAYLAGTHVTSWSVRVILGGISIA